MSLPASAAIMDDDRVPSVTGGDEHGVDIVAIEQLAEVAIGRAGRVAVLFVGHLLDGRSAVGSNVSDGHKLHVGLGKECDCSTVAAAVANPDSAER